MSASMASATDARPVDLRRMSRDFRGKRLAADFPPWHAGKAAGR